MKLAAESQASYDVDLLLVLPVCVVRGSDDNPDELMFESQACNGMERWLENFSRVEVICPILPDNERREARSTIWKPVSEIANVERVRFIPLPRAMSLGAFSRVYFPERAVLRTAIQRARYLCFAIGGLFGDWGAVACLEAHKLKRAYAVWTDRVEHKVSLNSCRFSNPLQRIKAQVRSKLMRLLERRCIGKATLGLFHGASCYAEYSPWCRSSFLVQDFPSLDTDAITDEELAKKCNEMEHSCPLRLAYVGRADEMKGPFDWLDVMQLLYEKGVSFTASWLGDGPLLETMRSEVSRRGLRHMISLPGFVAKREEIFGFLRSTHLFVFCHKTPESPRCLVEALLSGNPIVGYASEYAAELTDDGGGVLVGVGEKGRLADEICALDSDRPRIIALARAAVPAGKRINQVADFRYRSQLIKSHL